MARDTFRAARAVFLWFRLRPETDRLARIDADVLMRDEGNEAYWEARRRERDVVLADGTTHQGRTPGYWRRVALIIAKRTNHRVGLDTASRFLAGQNDPIPNAPDLIDDDEINRLRGI
jgi:hypothetical protein